MERLLMAAIAGVTLLGCAGSADAQNTKMINEDGISYSIKAPDKWVFDNAVANAEHFNAVALPASENWNSANSKIYSTVEEVDNANNENIATVISFDKKMYLSSPDVAIFDEKPIAIENGKRYARVLKIDNGADGMQVIAYIDEQKAVPTIVMISASKEDYLKEYPLFVQVVSSYAVQMQSAIVENTK